MKIYLKNVAKYQIQKNIMYFIQDLQNIVKHSFKLSFVSFK